MRFLLNERVVEVPRVDPNLTLLRFLRTEAGLPGTKEGCASGDCGACTVLVAPPDGSTRSYRALNACIMPLGAAAGQHVLTVEGLGEPGRLHPVQQAMVEANASQCGFCTPGFVMALSGLYLERSDDAPPDRAEVIECIAGNLCRCTGYRPIIDAGLRMCRHAPSRSLPVPAMPPGEDAPPALGTSGYWCPSTEAELQQLLRAHPDAPLLAGGTDFMLEITQRYRHFETLIDLSGVDALRGIEETEATWNIGAAVVLHELEAFFASRLAPLARLLKRFGSRQIRHRATLGGNLANASPLADLPPLLLVLDATLVLRDALGAERRLRVSDFYRGYKRTELRPREYIARALVPRPASGQRVELHKLSKRYEDDSAAVMLAVSIGVAGNVRVAFGGMAATPARAHAAEAALRGHALAPDSIEAALQAIGEDFAPIDDVRASARYRLDMARNLLRRALVTDAAATIFDDG